MTMPRKKHRARPDDWSQAMTWTIRVEMPRDLRQRTAGLDRALRLSERDRRRAQAAESAAASDPAAPDQLGDPDERSSAA